LVMLQNMTADEATSAGDENFHKIKIEEYEMTKDFTYLFIPIAQTIWTIESPLGSAAVASACDLRNRRGLGAHIEPL
jgi:hypothetical protein